MTPQRNFASHVPLAPRASNKPSARQRGTLEPVWMGRVIVREWIYHIMRSTTDEHVLWGFAKIGYRERVVSRNEETEAEWRIVNARAPGAIEHRKRTGRL